VLFVMASLVSIGQVPENQCLKTKNLISILKAHHVEPKAIDDSLSSDIFDNLFHLLDPDRLLFTHQEISRFTFLRFKIDDHIRNNKCDFLDSLVQVYVFRLKNKVELLTQLSQETPDFQVKDTVKIGYFLQRAYPVNEEELLTNWRNKIKYEVLSRANFEQNGISDQMEKNYRLLCGKYIEREENVKIRPNEFVYQELLNSIASSFDPHTNYFSQLENEKFESSNSLESLSFGIDFSESLNGDVIIADVIPGSSAWKTQKLNKGDIITALSDMRGQSFDLTFYDVDEMVELLEKSDTQVKLTVKKVNGDIVSVHIKKQLLRAEQNSIKSLILDSAQNKVAYISFPGFYSKNEFSKSGCAEDLTKEIIKLKEENIDGIILDIRNNGGGDMMEALNVAGIFIDRGTLCLYRQYKKDASMKDMNLGTAYDGPLVVMINGASASASELLAAALQDNNRAMIVGSPTFGKATGQIILPVFPKTTETDFVKVTTLKFYRVTGRSHQGEGISPNIMFGELFDMVPYREKDLAFSLPSDKTHKKAYYYPLRLPNLNDLIENSRIRIDQSLFFKNMRKDQQHILRYLKGREFLIPVDMDSFSYYNAQNAFDNSQLTSPFNISLNTYDTEVNDFDDYGSEVFINLQKDISSDPYVHEAFNIMLDYINIYNN